MTTTDWIKLDIDWLTGDEMLDLAGRLAVTLPTAIGYAVRLVATIARYHPAGWLTERELAELAVTVTGNLDRADILAEWFIERHCERHSDGGENGKPVTVTVTVTGFDATWGAQNAARRAAADRARKSRQAKALKRAARKQKPRHRDRHSDGAVTPDSRVGGVGGGVSSIPEEKPVKESEEQKSTSLPVEQPEERETLYGAGVLQLESEDDARHSDDHGDEMSPAFLLAWSSYPKRLGGNSRVDAWKAWRARVKQGVSEIAMLQGTIRYRDYAEGMHLLGTQYVKQGATFYGPGKHWEEAYELPPEGERPTGNGKRAPQQFAYAGTTALEGAALRALMGDD